MKTLTHKKLFRKKATTMIVSILIATVALSLSTLPTVSGAWDNATQAAVAAGMKWDFPGAANYNASATRLLIWNRYQDRVPTRTYNVIAPNPVGVGQLFTVIYYQPIVPPDALIANDIRYEYYNVITKPDGSTERLPPSGTITSDPTGTNFFAYTPSVIGNYSVTTVFVEQVYRWYSSNTQRDYYGVTLLQSNYTSIVTVQQEPVIPIGFVNTPLPTEYWTRPIEGQNTEWYRVASNWLSNAHDQDNGGPNNRYQQDGTAPNSPHIIWTTPTEDGGLIGGGNFSVPGEVFNAGHQYQPRFQDQIIMYGRLYYSPNLYWSGSSNLFRAVDLRTGELLWEKEAEQTTITFGSFTFTTAAVPTFGYYYDFDTPNQHGVTAPGWLFSNNFGFAYHPARGDFANLNLTNVPSGFEVVGPKGEVLRYVLSNVGTSSNPQWYLAQWNSSLVLTSNPEGGSGGASNAIVSGKIPANVPITPARPPNQYWNGSLWVSNTVRQQQGYAQATIPSFDWNVSIDASTVGTLLWGRPGQASPTVRTVIQNDILFGSNGSTPQGTGSPSFAYPENSTWWSISLKPANRGQFVMMTTIKTVNETLNDMLSYQRAAEGVFVFVEMPTLKWLGYSMYTGQKLWETRALSDFNPFGYFSFPSLMYDEASTIAYGKLFVSGYIGGVFAFDLYNGTELWNYTAPTDMSVFKYYTLMLGGVADGKLFVGTHEHSADTPLFKGGRLRVLDVNTGEPLYTMLSWPHPRTMAIADGTLIYWNNYDHQIYAVAKGPSQTTVEAPMSSIAFGSSLVIQGTVMDISPGTKQKEQALRFPNGVSAISDASQSQWMEYVYMQKERPTNAIGVEVTLNVLDSNNNFREIGKTTSNTDGLYSLQWTPDIPGKYTVYASFAGSESYWPSHASAAFAVDPPPPTAPAEPEAPPSMTDTYVLGGVAAIIVAIAVVGAVVILVLKRKP